MMSANFVLDILLSLIVILFVPIGFWRGALKEVLVTAAVLLGAAIGLAWAAPWGGGIAGLFDVRQGVGRFIVAAVALFVSVLLLGYGAGTLLGGAEPSSGSRLLGCVIAAVNGALLLGYALTFINSYLLDNKRDQAINNGRVAGLFLHHFDWVLLASGIALALAVIAALVYTTMQPAASHPPAAMAMPSYAAAPAARRYPPRVPAGSDGGKFEPTAIDPAGYGMQFRQESAPIDASGFDPGHWGSDRGYPVIQSSDGGQGHPPSGLNGYSGDAHSADEWLRRAAAMPWGTVQPADSPPRGDYPVGAGPREQARCPVCGGSLGPNDAFCPLCGTHV